MIYQLALFAHALRLGYQARRLRLQPVSEVAQRMLAFRGLPRQVPPAEAQRAAARACRRLERWLDGVDSCLTRSLVAGVLLADRAEVVLHVGFRSVRGSPGLSADGHAWLTLGGEAVGEPHPEKAIEAPFSRVFEVPLSRGACPMSDFQMLASTLRGEHYSLTKLADATGVLLNVDARLVHTLNETGVFLVEAIMAGAVAPEDLVAALVTAFEVDQQTAAQDVTRFLEELGHKLALEAPR
jgi:hypothetical protein